VDGDTWFMDYRNADGSIAEMCGNGVRVFAAYLVEQGLAGRGEMVVGTRNGPRRVRVGDEGRVTVDMGRAAVEAERSPVSASGRSFDARAVDVGNPHLVVLTDVPVAELNVAAPPDYDAARFPHGVNVEFVNVLGAPDGAGTVLGMRVHERGVGETRACGTGTVATVAAWLASAGRTEGVATVRMPGGSVTVTVAPDTCTLTGPAVLVASGTLDPAWWEAVAAPQPV
jgi:diaminopimelate epimerase